MNHFLCLITFNQTQNEEAIWGNSSDLVSHVTGMKILAISTEKRMDVLPNVPTFQELGIKFYPAIDRGVMVTKAVPREIQVRLEKAILDTTSKPEFKAKMEQAGFVSQVMGIAESQKYLDSETKLLNKLIQDYNLLQPTK